MKNSEIAKKLMELANVYGTTPDANQLAEVTTYVHVYSKEAAIALIKAVGGRFNKRVLYEGSDTLIYESLALPGFEIWIPRDKVCRKIPARYECEPLLSPDEEAAIFNAEPVEAGRKA